MSVRRFALDALLRRLPAGLTGVVAAICLSAAAAAGVNTGHFGNVAIQGYDPVADFPEGRSVKGR
jgi:hypothetical protein